MIRTDEKAWYKQFWPWFIIGMIALVIIACFYTMYLAMHNPLSMVKKDYYQEGLTINKNLNELHKAKKLGLRAKIQQQGNHILNVSITSSDATDFPTLLTLQFNHPVDDSKDLSLTLRKLADNSFSTDQLTEQQWQLITSEKRWYLQLQPLIADWILQTEVDQSQLANFTLDASGG